MTRRILVAYDGSEAAFRALEQATEMAQAEDAEVGVVTVLRPERLAAEQAAAYLLDHGIEAQIHTPVGEPAEQIRQVVEAEGYDTV
ncbi:MAG: universal stress protein [Chloroflexota bacterium]|nr:universal stress protein [Chloroflexota bacterium]